MILNKILRAIRHPGKIILFMDSKGLLSWVPSVTYEKLIYQTLTGLKLDLQNPQLFNEKIIWLKLFWYDNNLKVCADKYLVRNYLEEHKLSHLLNNLYAVYEKVEDIDISMLPDSFILKVSNGSGWNIICKDKKNMDWDAEFDKLRKWMKADYYTLHREWVYQNTKPWIVCERLLIDEDGQVPCDYKIFCFNGETKLIQVDIGRFNNHKRNFYDTDWNFQDVQYDLENERDQVVEKPVALEEMLKYSRILSKNIPFARIDLYYHEGKVVFGEITIFPCAGYHLFKPIEYGRYVGSLINLPPRSV